MTGAMTARPTGPARLTPAQERSPRQWRNTIIRKRLLDHQRVRLIRLLRLRTAGRAWLAAREREDGIKD